MTSREVLLQAVNDFLQREVQPKLDGVSAYKNRIASNLLSQMSRECSLAPAVEAADTQLAIQFGLAQSNSNAELSQGLRDGSLMADKPVLETLRYRTMLQMAIDNPRYSGFRSACERWPELAERIPTAKD